MSANPRYPVILRPLSEDEGGGWIAIVPDLPGCMSDGATGDEAFRNVLDAIEAWEESAQAEGQSPPDPDSFLNVVDFPVPSHLRPQIEALYQQVRATVPDDLSREQIMAGIMLQLVRGTGPSHQHGH